MDLTIPGFEPAGMMPIWWRSFHETPDVPEALVEGKEMMYLSWFYRNLAYNPSAITQTDINEFVSHYSLLEECMQDLSIIEHYRRMQFKI